MYSIPSLGSYSHRDLFTWLENWGLDPEPFNAPDRQKPSSIESSDLNKTAFKPRKRKAIPKTKAVQRTHHRETQEEELEDDITPIDKESSLDETAGSTLAVPEKATLSISKICPQSKTCQPKRRNVVTPDFPISISTMDIEIDVRTTIDENLDDTLDLNDKERSTLSPTDAAEKDSPAGGENTRTALLEVSPTKGFYWNLAQKVQKTDKKDMPHESSPIIDTTDSEEPPLVTEIENSPPENQNESMTPLSQNVPGTEIQKSPKRKFVQSLRFDVSGTEKRRKRCRTNNEDTRKGNILGDYAPEGKDTPAVNPTETEMPGEISPPRELVQYITQTSCRQLNRDLDEISRLKTVRNIREKSAKRADVADDVIDSTLLIQNVLRLDNKSMKLLHRMSHSSPLPSKHRASGKKANKVHVVSNEIVSRKITAVRDKPESVDSPAPGESNPKAKSSVDALGVESHVVDESNTAIERDSVALGVNSPTLNQKDIETKSAVDATGVNSPAVVTGTINTSSSTAHNWCKFTSGRHKQHRRQQPYCGAPSEVTSPRKTGTKSKSVVDALGVESHVVDESNTAIERDSVALGVNSPTLNDRGIETKSAVDATGVNSPALSKTLTKVKSVVNATAVNSPAVVTGTINTSSSTAVLRVTSPAPSPTNITVRSKVSTTGVNSPAPSKTLTKIEGVVNATGVNSPAIGKGTINTSNSTACDVREELLSIDKSVSKVSVVKRAPKTRTLPRAPNKTKEKFPDLTDETPSKTLTKIEGVVNATGVNSPAIGKGTINTSNSTACDVREKLLSIDKSVSKIRRKRILRLYVKANRSQILRDARIGTELQHTISRGTANVSKIATIIANHRDTIDFEHFNRSEAKKSHRFSTTSLRSVKNRLHQYTYKVRYDEIRTKLENIPRIENVPNAIIEEFDAQEQF
ncbi:hypothetical protein KQX54_019837 [Cotesia glomerata]|uniref:Uncharacterized protein n=1 Tax=Cotesia glomerata TaxID=32391 RepID=A0AAV7IV62_COTGL|nr:hypothetical protein KQX54_019837 [Cotesia glomerata]